jgi:diguanylate cyclase (GGDEF)-like protein
MALKLNDQMRPDAGDALLKIVAERLIATLRDSDFIARLGGDEFLIVPSQISERYTTAIVAQKLVEVIGKPYPLKGGGNFYCVIKPKFSIRTCDDSPNCPP